MHTGIIKATRLICEVQYMSSNQYEITSSASSLENLIFRNVSRFQCVVSNASELGVGFPISDQL